jgi:hypothetical protein
LRSVTAAAPTGAGGEVEHGASSKTGFANPGHPHRRLSQQNLPVPDSTQLEVPVLSGNLAPWNKDPVNIDSDIIAR